MESFFHTLKTELVMHCDYKTRDDARISLFSCAPDAPFGMIVNEVEPTLFVGQNEARRSLRIADIRRFQCSNAGPLRERQLLMGSN